ncbi:MAG: hypothetical protein RPU34_05290 [Candidatus Sedimenticola sp. (ex Thyasira tokunagai)]
MEPRAFLNLLSKEWALVVEVFDACKSGPIDHGSLLQLIDTQKRPKTDTYSLFEHLIDLGIFGKPLSGETLYQLGGLAETIISQLLQEHRLGLSENIQAHITHLDELSQRLLHATTEHDAHAISSGAKKLWQHTQDIKHQIDNNLQAISNIVAEAKKQETNKPLRQRYADVIDAWEQYITPMGEMIEAHGAFDTIIDSAIGRMSQAINNLDSAGALISEISNIRSVFQMLNDMRWNILRNFQVARDVLKPLYEVARLNSKVTRGASIVLDNLQKGRIKYVNEYATLLTYRRPRISMVSPNNALLAYYFGVKEVEERPAPMITTPAPEERKAAVRMPPLNINTVLKQLKTDLPIDDIMDWAIDHYPEHPTDKILDIVLLVYSQSTLSIERSMRQGYQTATHRIEGPSLAVESANA